MNQQPLTPRQFAQAIGVSESSVRRWADDGRIRMSRTAGGHRKIPRSEAIRFIRRTGAEVVRPDLLDVDEPAHRRARREAFGSQQDELLAALEKGDSELVHGLLTRMYVQGVDVAEMCDGPLRHAMQRIGERWPDDKRAILLEHRATSICIDALNRLRARFPKASDKAPVAIGAAPEGDPYVLPSLMACVVLADVGWRPVNLGPHTPLEVLGQAALEAEAELVWIAVTASLPQGPLKRGLAQLARHLAGSNVSIVIGGRGAPRVELAPQAPLHELSGMAPLAAFAQALLASRQQTPGPRGSSKKSR